MSRPAAALTDALVRDAGYAEAVRAWIVERTQPWRPAAPLITWLQREYPAPASDDLAELVCGGEWSIAPHHCWRCGGSTAFPLYRRYHVCEWCREPDDEPVDLDPHDAIGTDWWKRPRNACLALVEAGTAMIGGTAARAGDAGLVLTARRQFGAEAVTARFGARNGAGYGARRIVLAPGAGRAAAVVAFARLLDALDALFTPYRYDAVSKAMFEPLVFGSGTGEPYGA